MRNRCRCKNCGDVIESKHRHDFVRCSCGAIFTDGGRDYIRRGTDPEKYPREKYANDFDVLEHIEDEETLPSTGRTR